MYRFPNHSIFVAIIYLALLCVFTTPANAGERKPVIVSSILPLHLIVNEIAGDHATATLLFPKHIPVHHVLLAPEHIITLRRADHIIIMHPALETYLLKPLSVHAPGKFSIAAENASILLPRWQDMDGMVNIEKSDSHLWLHPDNAIGIAKRISKILTQLSPTHASDFEDNFQHFKKEITTVDKELHSAFSTIDDLHYAALHDSLRYFEKAYGFQPASILGDNNTHQLRAKEVSQTLEDRAILDCVFIEPDMHESPVITFITEQKLTLSFIDPLGYSYHPKKCWR